MKITYTPNPLRTIIELDEHEQKELWYKIKIEQMQWKIVGAQVYLEDGKPEKAIKELDHKDYYKKEGQEKSDLDQEVDRLFEYYHAALSDIHCGDCTCVPASCEKCHAESLLGIDTMPGLGKHEASKIGGAFDRYDMDEKKWYEYVRDLDQAIDYLGDHSANFDEKMKANPPAWKGWEAHVPRWREEGKKAHEWLRNYREVHFK